MFIPIFIRTHDDCDCDRRERKPISGRYQYWQSEENNKKYKREKLISNIISVLAFSMIPIGFVISILFIIDVDHPIFSIFASVLTVVVPFILLLKMHGDYDNVAELYSYHRDKTTWNRYMSYEHGYTWSKPDSEIPEGYILVKEGYIR